MHLQSERPDLTSPNIPFTSLRAVAATMFPPVRPASPPPGRRWRRRAFFAALPLLVFAAVSMEPDLPGAEPAVTTRIVSGTSEPRITATGEFERWHRGDVLVTVDERLAPLLADPTTHVAAAVAEWREAAPGLPRVAFARASTIPVSLEPDGINAVTIAPIDIPGHESDLAITISFSDSARGEILEADVVLNSRHPFAMLPANEDAANEDAANEDADDGVAADDAPTTDRDDGEAADYRREEGERGEPSTSAAPRPSCDGDAHRAEACERRFDVASVLTHELGHFFGLSEDRDDDLATMYHCTSACETHKRTLEAADRTAIAAAYTGDSAPAKAGSCSTGAPRSAPWHLGAVLAMFGAIVAASARRRRSAPALAGQRLSRHRR